MPATTVTPIRPMIPVRRIGARPGALHAALPGILPGEWVTACGETLEDGPRGRIVPILLADAHDLIRAGSPVICRRCSRVGDSVSS
jgi:hypothetical protein